MTSPSPTIIRLGFIPLLDAAIPIVAADKGLAAEHGLDILLARETSWANIRDRIAIGHFEAAHMLAPMPVAAALGLTPLDVPLIAPMALGLGGNAVTVSEALWQAMQAEAGGDIPANDPVSTGASLKAAILSRGETRHLTFAVVHPYSAHNYELRYWLAASGIRPDQDVEIAILPPPLMPDALASGRIDGFCVGEPWNSNAARRFGGRIVLTKSAIWRAGPEKVLGLRTDWATENPETVSALLDAMLDAAGWCADPANTDELVSILAKSDRLNLPEEDIAAALQGRMLLADSTQHRPQDFMIFSGGSSNLPARGHALWFLSQMVRWGQAELSDEAITRVEASFSPALFLAAARRHRPVLASADIAAIEAAVSRPVDGFYDGLTFEPSEIEAYIARLRRQDRG